MSTDLFDRYAALDPASAREALPEWASKEAPVLLSTIDERTIKMETKVRPDIKAGPSRGRRAIVAAAAFAVVVVIGLVAVLARDGGPPPQTLPPATTPPTTEAAPTTTVAPAIDEVAIVLAAFEAQNGGDFVAFEAMLTDLALLSWSRPDGFTNAMTELVGCSVTGTAPTGESIVECESSETDDYYGVGGLVEVGTATILVTEDGEISRIVTVTADDVAGLEWEETAAGMFNFAFWTWLAEAYPAVFAEIGPIPTNMHNFPGFDDPFTGDRHEPEEMLTAIEYVAEFVAQSDVYPISR